MAVRTFWDFARVVAIMAGAGLVIHYRGDPGLVVGIMLVLLVRSVWVGERLFELREQNDGRPGVSAGPS